MAGQCQAMQCSRTCEILLQLVQFTVCAVVVQAMQAYCLSVMPQVVLCVGSMFWTQEVAESIRSNALPAYSKRCTDDLLDVSYTPPSHAPHICALFFTVLTAPDISQLLLGFNIAVTMSQKTTAPDILQLFCWASKLLSPCLRRQTSSINQVL